MHHLPAGNGPQRLPHFALKRGACRGGWQSIDDAEIAFEVGRKLVAQPARVGGADTFIPLRAVVNMEQFFHPVAVLFPFDGAQAELLVRDHPQRPERRRNLIFE